jgi:hypothetical protein
MREFQFPSRFQLDCADPVTPPDCAESKNAVSPQKSTGIFAKID